MEFHDKLTLSIAESAKNVLEGKKQEEVKYPHDMYKGDDVKSAKDAEEHEALTDDGYTTDKPVDEVAEPEAKSEKDFKAKHVIKKSGEKEDGTVVKEESIEESKFSPELIKAYDAIEKLKKGLGDHYKVANALKGANESVDEAVETLDEESDKQKKYKAFFQKALKKFGVKTPAELEGDKKKEFFDYVDAGYEADNEED